MTAQPLTPDFYQRVRAGLRHWAQRNWGRRARFLEYLLVPPDVLHLLIRLVLSGEVTTKDKVFLIGGGAYLFWSFDFLPELFFGPLGFVDDLTVVTYVIHRLVNHEYPERCRRYWAGTPEGFAGVSRLLRFGDDKVGSGLWRRLRRFLRP